jgi:hypothetical protein
MYSAACCRTVIVAVLAAPFLADCGSADSAAPSTDRASSSLATTLPPDSPYKAGFRAVYLPVLHKLDVLGGQCNPVSRAKLPDCRKRLAAFQKAVTKLQQYVADTPPPENAKAAAVKVGKAARTMQATWSKLARYEAQGNVAAANGMAGFGKPLTNNLMAWVTAIQVLDIKLGGELMPIPSG